jgi:hypothetical protein
MFSMPVTTVAKVRKLAVCDRKGIVRAVLGEHDDGTFGLRIFDAAGKTRATLGVESEGGACVYLHDKDGELRLELLADPNNASGFQIRCPGGKRRAWCFVAPNGQTGFVLGDANQTVRAGIELDVNGTPYISAYDKEGHVTAELIPPARAEQRAG